ncbi:MAG TPA: hypothetical protein VI408_09435 [Gaiellaceae bacterium]
MTVSPCCRGVDGVKSIESVVGAAGARAVALTDRPMTEPACAGPASAAAAPTAQQTLRRLLRM